MPWNSGAVETLLCANASSSGRSASIGAMTYEGSREIYTPFGPLASDVGDIVRITVTGFIESSLNPTTATPVAAFTLLFGNSNNPPQQFPVPPFNLPKKNAAGTGSAKIPFWLQFLLTYTEVLRPPNPQPGTLNFELNGIVLTANDLQQNWSTRPRSNDPVFDANDPLGFFVDVTAALTPAGALAPGEILVVIFDQCAIEYLWAPEFIAPP